MNSLILLPAALTLLALLSVIVGARVLMRTAWVGGFVRGTAGLLFIVLALTAALSAYDLYSYRQLLSEHPVAELSFERLGPQEFRAVLQPAQGESHSFVLKGDYWQLDARFIKWKSVLARAGVPPAYRLERISGRYQDIGQETGGERTAYELKTLAPVDIWRWLQRTNNYVDIADTEYGSATYLPMKNGARYQVYTTFSGLIARPANPAAEKAVGEWSS